MFLDGSPTPPIDAPDAATATRTRVRWENLLLLFVAVSMAAVVVAVIAGGQTSTTTKAPAPASQEAPLVDRLDTAVPTSDLTVEDALGLVEEARQLMGEGRWDEAADRLASVPEELRDAAGAGTVQLQLEVDRTRFEQLRDELTASVEAKQWRSAASLLDQLAAIAPLTDDLLETKATVDAAQACDDERRRELDRCRPVGPQQHHRPRGGERWWRSATRVVVAHRQRRIEARQQRNFLQHDEAGDGHEACHRHVEQRCSHARRERRPERPRPDQADRRAAGGARCRDGYRDGRASVARQVRSPRPDRARGHRAAVGTASRTARTACSAWWPWRCSRDPPPRSTAGSA